MQISAEPAQDKSDAAAFPNISKLLEILTVFPISRNAEAEHIFSKVTRVLTSIHTIMSEKQLESLFLIAIANYF